MADNFFVKDDRYLLNYCAKYLARSNRECRHAYGTPGNHAPCEHIAEAWRFPIIDSYGGGAPGISDAATFGSYNEVTFIYAGADAQSPPDVSVIGTFATLYEPTPMRQVAVEGEPSRYWSLTCVVPKGQVHRYRFVVEGTFFLNDPVNPQRQTLDNGIAWSRFFTESFTSPLVMERWELDILYRLATEILPFQTAEASNFLSRFYNYLDQADRDSVYASVYRLDDSAGEVNFIDNILAREERHHLTDYKICLRIIDQVLRQRNPFTEPGRMSRDVYFDLYNEMASNNVAGWDYQAYSSPQYFLYLLRRHAVTGAFCHPKYGGNTGAASWAYLSERYRVRPSGPDQPSQTLFDWRRSIETPLGVNVDYVG
ncbi:MAG TPA: gluconate 2-dehydrogenase subunit 3 family protein [Candidatus Sulfotelmatobacter sp.]